MSDDFEEIPAPAPKAKPAPKAAPAPKEGPLKLKDVQAHPELMGPPAAVAPPAPAGVPMPPDAPWFQCWNVDEAHPNDGTSYMVDTGQGRITRTAELHPPFQSTARTDQGEHPLCPVCGRKTVMRLENYTAVTVTA